MLKKALLLLSLLTTLVSLPTSNDLNSSTKNIEETKRRILALSMLNQTIKAPSADQPELMTLVKEVKQNLRKLVNELFENTLIYMQASISKATKHSSSAMTIAEKNIANIQKLINLEFKKINDPRVVNYIIFSLSRELVGTIKCLENSENQEQIIMTVLSTLSKKVNYNNLN